MKFQNCLKRGLALFAVLLLTGCASFEMARSAPQQSVPIRVSFDNAELDGWTDLPIGTYRVPESQVIISGHQKGGAAGLLFGVVGIAIQHAANVSAGQDTVKDVENVLKINLTSQAQQISDQLVRNGHHAKTFVVGNANDAVELSVSTAVIMTFTNDTEVRPYVVMKASLRDPKSRSPIWTTRYFTSSGDALPLVGPQSWTANQGALLKQTLAANLERGIKFMLADVASPTARDEKKLTTVTGSFPFVKQRLQTFGHWLGDDANSIAYVPRIGDVIVFAGVNIMDKKVTQYRPKKDDDPFFKAIEQGK